MCCSAEWGQGGSGCRSKKRGLKKFGSRVVNRLYTIPSSPVEIINHPGWFLAAGVALIPNHKQSPCRFGVAEVGCSPKKGSLTREARHYLIGSVSYHQTPNTRRRISCAMCARANKVCIDFVIRFSSHRASAAVRSIGPPAVLRQSSSCRERAGVRIKGKF